MRWPNSAGMAAKTSGIRSKSPSTKAREAVRGRPLRRRQVHAGVPPVGSNHRRASSVGRKNAHRHVIGHDLVGRVPLTAGDGVGDGDAQVVDFGAVATEGGSRRGRPLGGPDRPRQLAHPPHVAVAYVVDRAVFDQAVLGVLAQRLQLSVASTQAAWPPASPSTGPRDRRADPTRRTRPAPATAATPSTRQPSANTASRSKRSRSAFDNRS